MELWNPRTASSVHSVIAHEDAISALEVSVTFRFRAAPKVSARSVRPCTLFQMEGDLLCSSSVDGVIKVLELRDTSLHPVFVSESVKLKGSPRATIRWRPVKSMAVAKNMIYCGDEGMNIKVLDWKQGEFSSNSKLTAFSGGCLYLVAGPFLLFIINIFFDRDASQTESPHNRVWGD